jgi:hypothetical protein
MLSQIEKFGSSKVRKCEKGFTVQRSGFRINEDTSKKKF